MKTQILDAETGQPFATLLSKLRTWPEAAAYSSTENVTFWADNEMFIFKDHEQVF
jgi:hypothetical protein